jgi:hypothetical protein
MIFVNTIMPCQYNELKAHPKTNQHEDRSCWQWHGGLQVL